MLPRSEESTCLLRTAFLGNALFSTLSGMTILFAQKWVLRILGLPHGVSILILGIGLIVFAATLVANALRQKVKTSDAWIAVCMDMAWVVGSYVLILVVPFSNEGKWLIALIAQVVLLFAILQIFGIRRLQKGELFG